MKKFVILSLIFLLFISCETFDFSYKKSIEKQKKPKYKIILVKHPDLKFPATNPDSIVIYEGGFKSIDENYFTIGKVGIIEFGKVDSDEAKNELKRKIE